MNNGQKLNQFANFTELYQSLDWSESHLSIHTKNASNVAQVLQKANAMQTLSLSDFAALLSPAAEAFIEPMAQLAKRLTQQRFGRTIQLYIPLYLSNMCSNICSYCGFSMHNNIRRTTLNLAQIEAELIAIKAMGFDHLLLVTGESERLVGMAYFSQVLPLAKRYFAHVSMEVQPLAAAEYRQLRGLGLDAVLVYQETYHSTSYAEHHSKGKKSDFLFRLTTPERLGQAEIDKIGLGCLLGLEDWRVDCFYLAHHLAFMQQRYWHSRYSISLPRLRPCAGGFQAKALVSDQQLVQLLTAFRLFCPELEISLSTRESANFRDHVLPLGVTTMSAASSTQPGGYSNATDQALEQFSIDDNRSPAAIAQMIQAQGYQTVWKDWQTGFS
jgi:2-iminoacetate synthase